jgi:hypothetical protein
MLVRSTDAGGGVVFRGEHPGLVLLIAGKRSRLGYEFGLSVPILNLETFRRVLSEELGAQAPPSEDWRPFAPADAEVLLSEFSCFQDVYRQMLGLLENPRANSAAIAQLLSDAAFDDLFVPAVAGENDHLFPASEGE